MKTFLQLLIVASWYHIAVICFHLSEFLVLDFYIFSRFSKKKCDSISYYQELRVSIKCEHISPKRMIWEKIVRNLKSSKFLLFSYPQGHCCAHKFFFQEEKLCPGNNVSWFVHLQETWLGNNVSWFVHLHETWLGNMSWFVHPWKTWLGNNVSWFVHL